MSDTHHRKYDVYGIGNALVDMEFQVTDQFLTDHSIEKGFMTLVEEHRQQELTSSLSDIKKQMASGGSAANSIIAVSQFGGKAYYSCKVANDDGGAFYLKDMKEAGVDTYYNDHNRPPGITGKCLVMVTDDAERTMNTFLGITATLSEHEVNEDAIKDSHYVYIEGYLVASPSGKEACIKTRKLARQHGAHVALTFSDPSMVTYFKDGLKEIIGDGVDLLFCNEQEAMEFTEAKTVDQAREQLKSFAKRFVITQGKNGALIFDGDTFIDIEPYPTNAVDTNGAGDMYAGAFLYGITHGHSYAQAGKIASLASSKVVTQYGPRLEWHQAKEILNHIFDRN